MAIFPSPSPCAPRRPPLVLMLVTGLLAGAPSAASAASFAVSYPEAVEAGPLDGRVILLLSKDEAEDAPEPRFQVAAGVDAIQVFGVDVEGLAPGEAAVVDAQVFGYPVDSLADLPAGRYRAQAVLHRYETFHRADGHVVKLPMDRGEGQRWTTSTPRPGGSSSPRRRRRRPSSCSTR